MSHSEYIKQYTSHFSNRYSKDIMDYVEKVFPDYIFTWREKKQQYGYCTHCRTEVKTLGYIHKQTIKCPNCKENVIVQSSGMKRTTMINEAYFIYYEKSVIDSDVIVARGIYAVEDYSVKNFRTVKPKMCDRTLYIFKISDPVMLKRYVYYSYNNCLSHPEGDFSYFEKAATIHSELSVWANKHYARGFACYSRESIMKAVKGTPFQYSMWRQYDDEPMVKFFELYCKYPLAVEYLTKLGFERLIDAKLTGDNTCSAVNWSGKTVFQMLRINRLELKQLSSSGIVKNPLYIKLFQINKKDKNGFDLQELSQVEHAFGTNQVKDIYAITKHTTLKKAYLYIKNQYDTCKRTDGNRHFHSFLDAMGNYRDYMKDCVTLEMDVSKDQVLFPKNLYTAHQNTISQVKIKVNEHLNSAFSKREKTLTQKYYFEHDGLFIRPAASANELVLEGQALNHCVGTYADRHAKGDCSIFFIRKASNPDKPYFTLELRQDRIIQTRGKNNCSPKKDVEEFIKVFTDEKLTNKKDRVKITVPA